MTIRLDPASTFITPSTWALQEGAVVSSLHTAGEQTRKREVRVRSRWLANDPFVVITPTDKVDEDTRRRIRSHVMKGKNRRRRRGDHEMTSIDIPDSDGPKLHTALEKGHTHGVVAADNLNQQAVLSVLSTVRFADGKAHKEHMHLLHQFYTVIKQEAYTIDGCMRFDEDQQPSHLEFLATDAAYMHCILFVTATWRDWIRGQTGYGPDSLRHLAKTLTYLQHNIEDVRLATSESTITVVILLAIAASVMGDGDAVVNHWTGLHKMVGLRGGLRSLSRHGRLESRACRLDIAVSLHTGQKPLFLPESISWRPYLAFLHTPASSTTDRLTPIHDLLPHADIRLVHVWADMDEFCRATIQSFSTGGSKLDSVVFHQALASIQYRLLHLDYTGGDITHEALRLCMLAFGTTVFLQIQADRTYDALAARLKLAILALERPSSEAGRPLMLWMLVVAAMSVFPETDLWLVACAEKLVGQDGFDTWACAKVALGSALWVDYMHGVRGEAIYRRLFHR